MKNPTTVSPALKLVPPTRAQRKRRTHRQSNDPKNPALCREQHAKWFTVDLDDVTCLRCLGALMEWASANNDGAAYKRFDARLNIVDAERKRSAS